MKKASMVVLAVLVLATIAAVLFTLSDDKGESAGGGDGSAATGGGGEATIGSAPGGGDKAAPVIAREDGAPPTEDGEAPSDLKIPGELPQLEVPKLDPMAVVATKPHGPLQLEGTLDEVSAETAIRNVFPPVRECYAELKTRAPQAKGRMLMRFRVSPGEEGKAGLGEFYLKETQFTDPKYLACVRKAIDDTKFKLDKSDANGTVEFNMFLAPEDAEKAAMKPAAAGQ